MAYLIFDNETQTHLSYKRKANPFDPRNYVVLRGWKQQGDARCSWQRFEAGDERNWLVIPPEVTMLVGHNIKFDLHYEMKHGNEYLKAFFKRGGRIWDTQYAEYLLRAQEQSAHMVSMDKIVESYGGKLKVDGIKELWNAGVQTSDIDPDLLLDYLVGDESEGRNGGDIRNTELIFLGQVALAKELGMVRAFRYRMDGLLATTDMEFNGIKVDMDRARVNLNKLNAELKEVEHELSGYVHDIPEEVGFNWGSGTHASCILFGGTIKYQKPSTYIDEKTGELARLKATAKWPLFGGEPVDPADCEVEDTVTFGPLHTYGGQPQDVFKGGKKKGQGRTKNVSVPGELKTRLTDFFWKLDGYTEPKPEWKGKLTDGVGDPVYGTGSDIIEELAKRDIPFLKVMGRNAALNKEIGTYYFKIDNNGKRKGMLTCVQKDGIVHPSLNHSSTATSRLSANNPNGQNFPRADKSDLKAIFVSRFGADGSMIEEDYSQLEVVVQGVLTGDPNLCRDLRDRVDFHCKRVALKNNITYANALVWCKDEDYPEHNKWKKERTKCKIFSFQRAYGAGASLIALETGMDLEEVKDMIVKEDKEYPEIVRFNNEVEAEVNATAEPFRDAKRGWRVFRKGTYQSPTGTMYQFRTFDAPSFLKQRGVTDTFKPTMLKNYPVQGTGGEIVQAAIGLLWRRFIETDNYGGKAFLVNTVHDCVWADAHNSVRLEVARDMKRILESVPAILSTFGIKCTVPFPVDAEWGPNMLELSHADLGEHA